MGLTGWRTGEEGVPSPGHCLLVTILPLVLNTGWGGVDPEPLCCAWVSSPGKWGRAWARLQQAAPSMPGLNRRWSLRLPPGQPAPTCPEIAQARGRLGPASPTEAELTSAPPLCLQGSDQRAPRPAAARDTGCAAPAATAGRRRRPGQPASGRYGGCGHYGGPGGA